MIRKIFIYIWRTPRNLAILLVQIYQKTLSPDHGWFKGFFPDGYCMYYPTCSDYMKDSLKKNGFIKGTLNGVWRILRCNPCSKGGIDNA